MYNITINCEFLMKCVQKLKVIDKRYCYF